MYRLKKTTTKAQKSERNGKGRRERKILGRKSNVDRALWAVLEPFLY